MNKKNKQEYLLDDDYFYEQEKIWRKSMKKLSDKEWLSIFPEAKELIPKKIKELKQAIKETEVEIAPFFNAVYQLNLNDFSEWFWEKVMVMLLFPELNALEKQLLGFNRLQLIIKPNKKSTFVSQDQIEVARNYPIYDIAQNKLELKPSGQNYVALCPFHQEKTPSFYLYPETNTFHCYGCQEHGDVIKLTMYLYGIDYFKDAVKMLQN